MNELHRFRHAEEMYAALAERIVKQLNDGIGRNGKASMVASGGTSPGELYDLLSSQDLEWKNIWITLSDERWVDTSSTRSNENLVRSRLMRGKANSANLVPMKTRASSAGAAEQSVSASISSMPRPFNVVLLGMGMDLHTASLIPGAVELDRAMNPHGPDFATAVYPSDIGSMGERLTLTLRAILDSRSIVLIIRGEEKLAAYKKALEEQNVLRAPVHAVLRQTAVPVSVYWAP
ncbi:MAG: 6-phosphogluconolactonase [Proteobacteria bacterium]|nr:6-phosphogluconolactonase [Pseudomonadota bacterium]